MSRIHRLAVLALAAVLAVAAAAPRASAVNVWVDRTKRMVDVPNECVVAPAGTNALAYNNGAGVNLAGVDGRFTFVLSTTARLLARAHNNALELSWYNFDPNNANFNNGLTPAMRLARAVALVRCGLPILAGDRNLYQYPAGAPLLQQTIAIAMGDAAGPDPRALSGYTLVSNGEREGILMYAATRIKFDLTPTILGRNMRCQLYANVEHSSGCAIELPAANQTEAIISYIFEGMNRISYTGHEFWMMFSNDQYRAKVFFTNGTQVVMGNTVDRFVIWQAGMALQLVPDAAGNNANYPPTAGVPAVAFQFQGLADGPNNHRGFFQTALRNYLNAYHPRVIVSGELL